MLICPNCKEKLNKVNHTYCCINKHSFDIAKNSYVNLLLPNEKKSLTSGDNLEMVIARKKFLEKGYYDKLLEILSSTISSLNISRMLDAGCGEGYFIHNLQCKFPKLITYGVDISKDAIHYAAQKRNTTTYIVANNKSIPLESSSIDLILNIFAPHFDNEFKRVLGNNSFLIKVIPGKFHLIELKELLYESTYLNDETIQNLENFTLIKSNNLNYKINLEDQETILNLFKMTPYYYKTATMASEVLSNLDQLEVTIDFIINLYKVNSSN